MNPRRILHNRCNKFAKSLQNWMVLQKWCNNFAKLLQLFYKGYCKMFAIGLQNLCKILAFISNLTKPVFAWFCKQFAMLLGERHQKVCKKSAKDRMLYFPEKSWPCLKKTLWSQLACLGLSKWCDFTKKLSLKSILKLWFFQWENESG